MTAVEDIREQIGDILFKSHEKGYGTFEFNGEKATDELCAFFSTLLDGLVMESIPYENTIEITDEDVHSSGWNDAAHEFNQRIQSIKLGLKGE